MRPELRQMIEQEVEKAAANQIEPPDGSDKTNPYIRLDALCRVYAEMHRQVNRNDTYYASGRCGGCEACGLPPYPDWTSFDWANLRAEMLKAILEIEENQKGVKSDVSFDPGF